MRSAARRRSRTPRWKRRRIRSIPPRGTSCIGSSWTTTAGGGEGSVQEYWTRSLRFLTPDIANAAFASQSEEVALVAAGLAAEDVVVENVEVRILPQPNEPHHAAATFDLIRQRAGQEAGRESWSVSMQFRFLPEIPGDLVVWNPMGIVISFLQGDRIVTSSR